LRAYNLYLADIAGAVEKILEYTKDYDYRKFSGDTLRVDAVVRNLEVIGEAAKHIPKKVKEQYPDVDWRAMAGMRDIITHEYFGVDLKIIWKTIRDQLPKLKKQIDLILAAMGVV
jgi:uncharacterized protein with HEPN domain